MIEQKKSFFFKGYKLGSAVACLDSAEIFMKRKLKRILSVITMTFYILSYSNICQAQVSGYGQRFQNSNAMKSGDFSSFRATQNSTTGIDSKSMGQTLGGGGQSSAAEYQVHVLGQVTQPGIYHVGPSVRIAELVSMAGEITKSGSSRNIELRQNNGTVRHVDLLQYTQQGDLRSNPFVQNNDVVFVPFVNKSLRIEGPVAKGGVYELANEKSVWDVIQLAGGYTVGVAQDAKIAIIRYDGKGTKNIVEVDNAEETLKNTMIEKGDIVIIPHIFTKDKKFDYNISSLPSDHVFYPSFNDNVFVVGAVSQGGSFPYNPNLRVQEYVVMAGPTPGARIKTAKVMTPNGKIHRADNKTSINPGDTIIVPEKKMTLSNILSWYSVLNGTAFSFLSWRAFINDVSR